MPSMKAHAKENRSRKKKAPHLSCPCLFQPGNCRQCPYVQSHAALIDLLDHSLKTLLALPDIH